MRSGRSRRRSRRRTSPRSRASASAGRTGSSTSRRRSPSRGLWPRRQPSAVGLSAPSLGAREEELVVEVLRSGRLSLGPMVDRFEELLAERVRRRSVAAVSSGTAGLHLCMRLAGHRAGDEVITSPFSFVASANCVLYEGATPVFADVDPPTLNLDPEAVEAASHRATSDPARPHLRRPAELEPLRESPPSGTASRSSRTPARRSGAEYRGRPVGSSGTRRSSPSIPTSR